MLDTWLKCFPKQCAGPIAGNAPVTKGWLRYPPTVSRVITRKNSRSNTENYAGPRL